MVGCLKLDFWVCISLELCYAKWELHIALNYQINVHKVNLSKFYPQNPLFTPQNGVDRSAELKPTLTMSARPQMTHTTQKIKMDRPVTRTPLFLTQESALIDNILIFICDHRRYRNAGWRHRVRLSVTVF